MPGLCHIRGVDGIKHTGIHYDNYNNYNANKMTIGTLTQLIAGRGVPLSHSTRSSLDRMYSVRECIENMDQSRFHTVPRDIPLHAKFPKI